MSTLLIGKQSGPSSPFAAVMASLGKQIPIKIDENLTDVTLQHDDVKVQGNINVTLELTGKQGWFNIVERLNDAKNLMPVCIELDEHLKLRSYLDDAIEPGLSDGVVWGSLRGMFIYF